MRVRRPDGFTLIELLVVIAIIAILAAILFPVFAQAREQARKASCMSNGKQLGMAFMQYKQDYDERHPFGGWLPGGGLGTWEWQNTVAPYIKNKGVYRCPSSTEEDELVNNPAAWHWNRNPVSYMYNNFLAADRNPLNDSAVVAPADCVLLSDGHSDWGCPGNACIGVDWMGRPNTIWLMEDTYFGKQARLITGWGDRTWGLPRHMNGANFTFADGHVKWSKVIQEDIKTRAQYDAINTPWNLFLEGRLPWLRHGDPKQGGTWGTPPGQSNYRWDM